MVTCVHFVVNFAVIGRDVLLTENMVDAQGKGFLII